MSASVARSNIGGVRWVFGSRDSFGVEAVIQRKYTAHKNNAKMPNVRKERGRMFELSCPFVSSPLLENDDDTSCVLEDIPVDRPFEVFESLFTARDCVCVFSATVPWSSKERDQRR